MSDTPRYAPTQAREYVDENRERIKTHLDGVLEDHPDALADIDAGTAFWRNQFAAVGIDPYDPAQLRCLMAVASAFVNLFWRFGLAALPSFPREVYLLAFACVQFADGAQDLPPLETTDERGGS